MDGIDKAFILGNGPDRPTDIEWLNNLEGDTYGCNAIYRDFEPDFLVANDWAMMVEIINSTLMHSDNPNMNLMVLNILFDFL